MAAVSGRRTVGILAGIALIATASYAAWHYYQTGRFPFGNAGEFTVSEAAFANILTQLEARPSIPPKFTAPVELPPVDEAARACALARQSVTFTQAVPEKVSTADTAAQRFALKTTSTRILSSEGTGGVVFAIAPTFAVNVDGSPRAYHPSDVYGRCETPASGPDKDRRICAINFLCYAGVRLFDGPREIACGARDDYKRAWDEMWSVIEAGNAKQIPRSYWRLSGNNEFDRSYGFFHPRRPLTVMFKDTIIRQDAAGKPCRRDVPGSKFHGYFVAATSLTGDEGADEPEGSDPAKIITDRRCDPIPYVDAEKLPSIVIPVGGFAGASVGDLVVGYRKDANGAERWVYALVGDEGPNHKFGEGSVAFNAAIKGSKRSWESYRDILGDLHISAETQQGGPVTVAIFKNTASRLGGILSLANVEKHAAELFAAWGNGEVEQARDRFRACINALK